MDSPAKAGSATHDSPTTLTVVPRDGRAVPLDRDLWSRLVLTLVLLGLGTLAFRELLVFHSDLRLALELEEFFFTASDTAPGVVVVLSLWLLFRRRARLLVLPKRAGPTVLWMPLAIAAAAALAWSRYTTAADLAAPALGLTILSVAVAMRGRAALRVVWLPAVFSLFAVPIPAPLLSEILFRLQLCSAGLSGGLLLVVGVPAAVSGDQIITPNGTFVFIESCSGLRSMVTLSTLAIIMLDLFRRRGLHAALVLLAAPLVAFGLNGVRAVLLIINPYSAIASIHNLQGLAILLAGLVLLYLLDGVLARDVGEPSEPASGGMPDELADVSRPAGGPGPWRDWAVASVVLAALAGVSLWIPIWEAEPLPMGWPRDQNRPELTRHWSAGVERRSDPFHMLNVGVREALHRRYRDRSSGRRDWVDVYVAIGDHSKRTATPFSPKTGLPGAGWIIESEEVARFGPDGTKIVVRQIRKGPQNRLVFHWYEGSRGFGDEVLRSLLALDQSPFRRPLSTVVVRLMTEMSGSGKVARKRAEMRLRRFLRASRDLRAWAIQRT